MKQIKLQSKIPSIFISVDRETDWKKGKNGKAEFVLWMW